MRTIAVITSLVLFAPPITANAAILWDNNLVPNGYVDRAISPPSFPNIRVVDDFVVPQGGWVIQQLAVNAIEDSGWQSDNVVEIYLYEDDNGRPRDDGLFLRRFGSFTKKATGDRYFGRADYDYFIDEFDPLALAPGKYWMGLRMPNGGGSGTNYWMGSDGGPDGRGTGWSWFSLDAGQSWRPEGQGYQYTFVLWGVPEPSTATLLAVGVLALLRRRGSWYTASESLRLSEPRPSGSGSSQPTESALPRGRGTASLRE
jgi:hypothetical protein